MVRKTFIAILGCLMAVMVAGCQASGTSAQGWGQIAAGAGQVIGSTPLDPKVAAAAEKLKRQCALLQTLAAIGSTYVSERQQLAAQQAQAALNTACAAPTAQNVAQLAVVAADAYIAAVAVRDGTVRAGGL